VEPAPRSPASTGRDRQSSPPAFVGVLLLLLGGRAAFGPGPAVALVAISLAALVGFLVVELRSADPLVDLRMFLDRHFSAGVAASFLDFVAMAANMFLLPFLLVDHLGLGAARAGLVMAVVPVAIVAAAPLAGIAADRVGSRGPATAALGAVTLAIVAMAGLRPGAPLAWVVGVLAVYGVGAALFQSPNISDVLGTVVSHEDGHGRRSPGDRWASGTGRRRRCRRWHLAGCPPSPRYDRRRDERRLPRRLPGARRLRRARHAGVLAQGRLRPDADHGDRRPAHERDRHHGHGRPRAAA
jgi:hypothetical protein